MNETTAIELLKKFGWVPENDEVGDTSLDIQLDDRIITITPSIKKSTNIYRISFTPTLSTIEFSETINKIDESIGISPLARMRWDVHKTNEVCEKTITTIANEIIDLARNIDIKSELARHAQLPTNSKGAMPLRHLAALALLGDTEKLEFYKMAFEAGDRLDFVPYISIEMIERALAIAQTNSAHRLS